MAFAGTARELASDVKSLEILRQVPLPHLKSEEPVLSLPKGGAPILFLRRADEKHA